MRNSQNATTILLALFIALFLAVLDWFFLVQPKMSATSEARAATESQRLANADLEIQLRKREEDFKNLPELKEQVWSIRDQFPPDIDAPAIREFLSSLDDKYGIHVLSDSIGGPVEVVPGASLAPAYAAFGLEPYADDLVFTSLSAVPITLNLRGSYETVMAYIDEIQVGENRYFSISSLSVTSLTEDSDAVPPTRAGDIDVTVSGSFFVLDHGIPGISVRPAPDPLPGEEPLPSEVPSVPSNDRNFFVPSI